MKKGFLIFKLIFVITVFISTMLWNSSAQSGNCSIVGHWLFNGNLNDQTLNANHGTSFNGVGYTTGVDGTVNGALVFDGVNDYVDIANHVAYNFGTGNFTLSYWFNTGSTAVPMRVWSSGFPRP